MKELLNIVLRIQPKSNLTAASALNAYSPEIIRYLLKNQVVCSAMIEVPGCLLGALRARNDWVNLFFFFLDFLQRILNTLPHFQNSIEQAFGAVLDLKEFEIIETLQFIISAHRRSPFDNAMQVDNPTIASSTVTSLPAFLNLSLTYPTSRAPLVSAVRRQLRDAEDLTILLEILNKWLARRTAKEEKLLPGKKDLKKTEHGIWTVVGRTAEKGKQKKLEEIPSLDKVNFLSFLLVFSSDQLIPFRLT